MVIRIRDWVKARSSAINIAKKFMITRQSVYTYIEKYDSGERTYFNTEKGKKVLSYFDEIVNTADRSTVNSIIDMFEDKIRWNLVETDYINEAIYKTEGASGTDWVPEFQGIHIYNITCNKARIGISAKGAHGTVHNIDIHDCHITYTDTNTDIDPDCEISVKNVTLKKF